MNPQKTLAAVVVFLLLALTTPVASAQDGGGGGGEPTLERITAEPDWIARSPGSPRWLVDGSGILYSARREGKVGRDFRDDYLIFMRGIGDVERPVANKITPENPGPYIEAGGDWDATGARRLVEHDGDLFLYLPGERRALQLTRTRAREGSGMFMVNGERIGFTRGGDWFIRSLSGDAVVEVQAADIRYSDAPEDPSKEREKEAKKRDHLQKQQRELFEIIRLDDERGAVREDDRHAWSQAEEPTDTPGPFYLGDKRRGTGSWLSPSGAYMLVATAPAERASDKRDIMPDYINEDGYVSTRSVRPKVGLQSETAVSMHLLDIEDERVIDLDLGFLPSITDDPLAWIKEKDTAAVDEGEGEGEDGDGSDDPEDAGTEPESDAEGGEDHAARPVSIMGARWSDSGRYGAFMLRSHDNKDRWIVLVDTETLDADGNPELRSAHHLHDEAWINWSFNQFGFVPRADLLWYVSEESNYARLYTLDLATGARSVHTPEGSEVRGVTWTRDGSLAYYRSNASHPGKQEIVRLHRESGANTAITSMGGTVGSFALSPDASSVVFSYSDLDSPPELYLLDLEASDATPKRLTHTISEQYLAMDFNTPEIVAIPSSHSEQPIYTRVYLPDAERFPGQRPIVIFVHGAGYTQHANYAWPYYFREHMFHTILNNEGYIVLAPDFRASEGYGRDWRTAIYRRMGYPELEDFADCIAWAAETHNGDRDRVGLYGGSYGGFMTLMAMFLEPETYRAGAALRSVTDWRHYNHGYTSNILNTPQIDPEAFDISSPINHAAGLEGHLLMLHGLLDDNVVAQDVIRLSQRLIELEKEDWELALHPIEPHGYQEPSSWLDQLRRIHKLFDGVLNDGADE